MTGSATFMTAESIPAMPDPRTAAARTHLPWADATSMPPEAEIGALGETAMLLPPCRGQTAGAGRSSWRHRAATVRAAMAKISTEMAATRRDSSAWYPAGLVSLSQCRAALATVDQLNAKDQVPGMKCSHR